jgi:hypothetical protein
VSHHIYCTLAQCLILPLKLQRGAVEQPESGDAGTQDQEGHSADSAAAPVKALRPLTRVNMTKRVLRQKDFELEKNNERSRVTQACNWLQIAA